MDHSNTELVLYSDLHYNSLSKLTPPPLMAWWGSEKWISHEFKLPNNPLLR